jgi:hypothetical protein
MPYTEEEGGRLNNYAVEPKIYEAKPPNKQEQRNYIFLGIGALLLVVGVIAVAFYASSANVG